MIGQNENLANKNRKWWWVLGLAGFFVLGVFVGQTIDLQNELFDGGGNVEIKKVIDLYGKTRSAEISFDQFWDVWDRVKENYAGQPVNEVDLFYGAIEGMVRSLDDPYSVYLPPVEAAEFASDLAGEFDGIGAEIGIRDNQLQVVAPLPESPAEKAGLRPGDKIFAIDGEETAGLSLEEAVMKIRGKKGTSVVLTISHDGFSEVEDVEIVRDTITVPTVYWENSKSADKLLEWKEDGIVYLRVSYFNQDTWTEFDKAVKEIVMQRPRGIVLDLRSNPGGFLETSVDVASEWVKQGLIVSEGESDSALRKKYLSRGQHRLADIPTVVLVDEGTASGSEIVAGALQDYQVATVVGTQTFGKGSVQDFQVLSDGSALKLTIAKWYTPKDREINEKGITPDVVLEEMFLESEPVGDEEVEYTDLGLEKALEILTNK